MNCASIASSVTASIGLTCVDSAQRAEDVIREADIALSTAKKDETTRTLAYSPAMGGQAASLVSLEADLHVALDNNELRLVFQPIVDLRTYHMVGAEALLRWRHPVEGMLTPDRFLGDRRRGGPHGVDHTPHRAARVQACCRCGAASCPRDRSSISA